MKELTFINYSKKMHKKIDELLKAHHFNKFKRDRGDHRYWKFIYHYSVSVHVDVVSGFYKRESHRYWCSPLRVKWSFSQSFDAANKAQRTAQNKMIHKYNKLLKKINDDFQEYGKQLRESSGWYCEHIAENV